jgi:hypothetical protein
MLHIVSISKDKSILTWIPSPELVTKRNQITFEGVVFNPGYQGDGGVLFHVTFETKKFGVATISFTDGSILSGEVGTNIIGPFTSTSFKIIGSGALDLTAKSVALSPKKKTALLPSITDYPAMIDSKNTASLRGNGEPNATTKLTFEDLSHKSLGGQVLDFVQSKKKQLGDIFVTNDEKGSFQYVTPSNLVAGVYNVIPFLVDAETKTSKAGSKIQFFINDSALVRGLIMIIDILILLIPIIILGLAAYFIPWYLSKRMRILRKRMNLEEEKMEIAEQELKHKE